MVEQDICSRWQVTDKEYEILEEQFGRYCHDVAWKLLYKNAKNNHTDDEADIYQEMRIKLFIAAAYQKRQQYIEKSLEICKKYVSNDGVKEVEKLENMWHKKQVDGKRVRFGVEQEELLAKLVGEYVPDNLQPKKDAPLAINDRFPAYCKSILQNRSRFLGKKITKERPVRVNQVSLSDVTSL